MSDDIRTYSGTAAAFASGYLMQIYLTQGTQGREPESNARNARFKLDMSTESRIILRETNSTASDQVARTYVLSTKEDANGKPSSRLDELPQASDSSSKENPSSTPRSLQSTSQYIPTFVIAYLYAALAYLKVLFLPTGYPQTVTPDYTPYQIYDSIQAFASTIASLLSSRAVLQSLNVISQTSAGKSDDSIPASSTEAATAATLLSILQSTLANLTTILFASRAAPRISPDVKFYRFLADVVNDAAFVLDLLAPSLPTSFTMDLFPRLPLTMPFALPLSITPRVLALCTSSMLRAICGVAAGSSKAVLSAHFARSNPENVGDLNAKDGSQETIINLMGMWVGGVVVSRVDGVSATWTWMLGLLGIHLWANYRAVRSVRLRGLNRERAEIVIKEIVEGKNGWEERINFKTVGARESVLGLNNALLNLWRVLYSVKNAEASKSWVIGVSIQDFVRTICNPESTARQISGTLTMGDNAKRLSDLLQAFENERYIPWIDLKSGGIIVVLKQGVTPREQLKSYLHALTVSNELQRSSENQSVDIAALLVSSVKSVNERWAEVCKSLERAGWDLDSVHLDDGLGSRLEVERPR